MKPVRIVIVLLAALLPLAATVLPASGQELAQIRFVHVDAGSPALDLYINGELAAANVTYRRLNRVYACPGRRAGAHGESGYDICTTA